MPLAPTEIEKVLEILDRLANNQGGDREQACFEGAKVIRALSDELAAIKAANVNVREQILRLIKGSP